MPYKDDEKRRAYVKKYFKNRYHNDPKYRKRIIAYVKKSQMKYPFRTWARGVINGHKRRGVTIEITRPQLEEIVSKIKTCAFCGCILKYGILNGKKKWHHDSASADRIDRTKPFNKENIQIICVQCNSAKSKLSTEEFLQWLTKVYSKLCLV